MKNIALSILLGVILVIGISNCKKEIPDDKAMNKAHYEIIKIKTKMGHGDSAAFFKGNGSQVVIFVPGLAFNKESWFFLAKRLQQLNVASLSLDGNGTADVLSSINFLKDKG